MITIFKRLCNELLIFLFTELHLLETKKVSLNIEDEPTVREYYELRQQLDSFTKDMQDVINHPNYCLPFLQPGRLVKIKYKSYDFGWGAVVNFSKRIKGRVSAFCNLAINS